jgi:hypothetical protein
LETCNLPTVSWQMTSWIWCLPRRRNISKGVTMTFVNAEKQQAYLLTNRLQELEDVRLDPCDL